MQLIMQPHKHPMQGRQEHGTTPFARNLHKIILNHSPGVLFLQLAASAFVQSIYISALLVQ